MDKEQTLTVSEATDMLHLKSEETIRRYIRAGHRAGNNLEQIIKIKDKKHEAYFSLCTVPNHTPYLITYQSMVLFIQRKLGKSKKEAEQIIVTYKSAFDKTSIGETLTTIGSVIGGIAAELLPIGTMGVLATSTTIGIASGITTTLFKNRKKKQIDFNDTTTVDQLMILLNDKKELENILTEHETAIDEIDKNLKNLIKDMEIVQKHYAEQIRSYEKELTILYDSKRSYMKELEKLSEVFRAKSQEI